MDMYGSLSTLDCFHIDDLLDFPIDDCAATSSSSFSTDSHLPPPQNPFPHHQFSYDPFFHNSSIDFTADLCLPNDDAAELEWLSQFVDDSFHDFPTNTVSGSAIRRSDTSFPSKARSKRSKSATSTSLGAGAPATGKSSPKTVSPATAEGDVRRCTHCASEKTPQWRTGPLGPKTLCNACGVRYKSGRLVPEYRPAASPTFVLTQHSNSHRKVMELRRQKELLKQQQQHQQEQCYCHQQEFRVC